VATGTIDSIGEEKFIDQVPSPEGFLVRTNFVFPEGTIGVALSSDFTQEPFGPGGCSSRNALSGTYEVTGGTGAFSGASGTGTFAGLNIIIGKPSADGCATDDPRLISAIRLTGTVTLPD